MIEIFSVTIVAEVRSAEETWITSVIVFALFDESYGGRRGVVDQWRSLWAGNRIKRPEIVEIHVSRKDLREPQLIGEVPWHGGFEWEQQSGAVDSVLGS